MTFYYEILQRFVWKDLTERKKNPTGNLDVGSDEISLEDLKSDIEPQAKKKPTDNLKIPDWKELIHNRYINLNETLKKCIDLNSES